MVLESPAVPSSRRSGQAEAKEEPTVGYLGILNASARENVTNSIILSSNCVKFVGILYGSLTTDLIPFNVNVLILSLILFQLSVGRRRNEAGRSADAKKSELEVVTRSEPERKVISMAGTKCFQGRPVGSLDMKTYGR